ncbi:hypothetical protein DMUE_0059 [Dictyocoela muelleri]|nr:hypothetical protein DMUE_0059 [Dictyocoela muelleri]
MFYTTCGVSMFLRENKEFRLFYTWKCLNYRCCKYQTTISILKGSFLENMRIDPRECMAILYYISENGLINKIASFTKINRKSIGIIFNKIEDKITKYLEKIDKIGRLGLKG